MIPLSLKISGIYSYRKTQEIDFCKLTSTHLFGIFGAVGSGKSALLEAIMFALYGETERLNTRDLRSYNMMNLKSNEALVEFRFLAAADKGEYLVTVRGKRNSKNKEDVKFDRALYKLKGGEWSPADIQQIPAIIGISYENFRRTIIIPQGKFQEFLQLTSTNRSEMLKELFGLEKFDLSFKTSKLQKQNDDAISNITGKLQQLGEITPEAVMQATEAIQQLEKEMQEHAALLKEKEEQELKLRKTAESFLALEKSKKELLISDEELHTYKEAEKKLAEFEECIAEFKTELELLDERNRSWQAEEQLFTRRKEEYQSALQLNMQNEQHFAIIKKDYDEREKLNREAAELEYCANANTAGQQLKQVSERIRNGEITVNETRKDLESTKAQALFLEQSITELRKQLPDIKVLQAAREWFIQFNNLKEKADSASKLVSSAQDKLKNSRAQLAALYALTGKSIDWDDSLIPQLLPGLQGKKDIIAQNLAGNEKRRLHLEVQGKLTSYAAELHDGEPCPLCGATEHPNLIQSGSFGKDLAIVNEEKNLLDAEMASIDTAISSAGFLINAFTSQLDELKQHESLLQQVEESLKKQQSGNPWPDIDERQLTEKRGLYDRIQTELENLDKQVKSTVSLQEVHNSKLQKYTEVLNQLRIDESRLQQTISGLLSRLTLVSFEAYASTTAEAILEQSAQLRDQYQKIEGQFVSAEKAVNESRQQLQTLSGILQKTEESQLALKKSIDELRKQLDVRILASRFSDESYIRSVLNSGIDRLAEQKRIRVYFDSRNTLAREIEKLEILLAGQTYDPSVHETLKSEIALRKATLDQMKEQKGGLEATCQRMKTDLEESVKLRAELNVLEIRRDNLKTLSDLFRSQGFVNFVSTLHLQNLVASANERFYRLTRQQLKLELDEENNFRIRDFLNEGQWRSVKTLSGGQTFQASLCLALALADNIQQLNQGGQNFFFLDEGFGTLDKESLELVFETLKSLRRENRIVGVISHVEEMKQEIGAWLLVNRDEQNGSWVTPSWELS